MVNQLTRKISFDFCFSMYQLLSVSKFMYLAFIAAKESNTLPSGGNVTCLEGSRQRGNGIPARQLCRILSTLSHASIHARHGLDVQSEISHN